MPLLRVEITLRFFVIGFALLEARLVFAQSDSVQTVIDGLESRAKELNRLYMEFEWFEYAAPLASDPFQRSNWRRPAWAKDERVPHGCDYHAWILRPWFRLKYRGPLAFQKHIDCNWLDGIRTSKALDADGTTWSVYINQDRWSVTGGIPVVTPLEISKTCDLSQTLLEIVQLGRMKLRESTGGIVKIAGGPLYDPPSPPWTLSAVLDRGRGWLPVEIQLETVLPNGKIHWTMRVLQSVPVGQSHAIKEAVLAMQNTTTKWDQWMVYHFLAGKVERRDAMTKDDLKIEIPVANVKLIDDVRYFARTTDDKGNIVEEEKWTPEERKRQIDALQEAYVLRTKGDALLSRRQKIFSLLVGGAFLATLILAGAWWWKRRRLLQAH